MGKKHASQYANFGWLQAKTQIHCNNFSFHTIVKIENIFYYLI